MTLGEKIKELRESKEILQRQLAASLEIDTPMFSKIERGDRRAKREQVVQLATLLKADLNELLTLWLADQVIEIIKGEEVAKRVIQQVEKQLDTEKR
ncbi:MAG: helix-turn-helix transcriptional regulator [Bacteroidota bacterium]